MTGMALIGCRPSSCPRSLVFSREGIDPIPRWLLSPPGGIRFRELHLTLCQEGNLSLTTRLVEWCSSDLESLHIPCNFHGTSVEIRIRTTSLLLFLVGLGLGSFSLSRATNLRDVLLRPTSWGIEWITIALQTITPGHRNLQRISIHVPYYLTYVGVDANVTQAVREAAFRQWSDLDRLLIQLWEFNPPRGDTYDDGT